MRKEHRTIDVEVMSVGGKPRLTHLDAYNYNNLSIGGNFTRQLRKEFGRNILYWSALQYWWGERILRKFLSQRPIGAAVDLGTSKGVTAALIAHYADRVYTLDREEFLIANCLWDRFGVRDKIKFIQVPTNEYKADVLSTLDFDFAFIDDQHDYEGAKIGFEATKKCGRVLFHDYCNEWIGVKKFVDTLPKEEITVRNRFACWEGENGASDFLV